MKMVIVICPESREREASNLMNKQNVRTFTMIKDVIGAGETGLNLGTQVWPGRSILIFSVVDDAKSNRLKQTLRNCAKDLYPGEGMRAFVLPIEDVV